jgi:hypothetical protein
MESSTAINSYQPIDLDTITRSRIQSDRELENEIAKICDVLKDTCKKPSSQWKISIFETL